MYESILLFIQFDSLSVFFYNYCQVLNSNPREDFMASVMLFPPAGEKVHMIVVTTTGTLDGPRRGYQWTPPCGRHGIIPASLLPPQKTPKPAEQKLTTQVDRNGYYTCPACLGRHFAGHQDESYCPDKGKWVHITN